MPAGWPVAEAAGIGGSEGACPALAAAGAALPGVRSAPLRHSAAVEAGSAAAALPPAERFGFGQGDVVRQMLETTGRT